LSVRDLLSRLLSSMAGLESGRCFMTFRYRCVPSIRKGLSGGYLTNNPRLPAGMELKQLMSLLCDISEDDFREALKNWHGKWGQFLKERTVDPSTGRWHYTRRRLRSAYRSLTTNLPYLFTYQKYPELAIPNTTNALDGTFAHPKELVNIHRGAGITLKTKIITEIRQK